MTIRDVSCPGCGAPRRIANPGTMMFVCTYCGNPVYWDADQVRSVGAKAALTEGFTRLYREAKGSLRGTRFETLGRVRYDFGRGFWDEWYLQFEGGTTAWLTEDNHELCLEWRVNEAPPPDNGFARVTLGGIEFVVEERGEARCVGAEGELPFVVTLGERYRYIDGSSPDGKHSFGIEYDAAPGAVFLGDWLAHGELALDDEGDDWT
jgi:Domain of unknown function (DUF4178)